MAHFAKIENGYVTAVVVVANEALDNLEFPESEPIGQKVLADSGFEGTWKQTSYNGNFRGIFAGVGVKWTGHNFKVPELNETPTE